LGFQPLQQAPEETGLYSGGLEMSQMRIDRWNASGAAIGALLAVLVLVDERHINTFSVFHGFADFFLCWPLMLTPVFLSLHLPRLLWFVLITFINACTFAFLFVIIRPTTRQILSRITAANAGGHQ
jgi:hypothetical protein